MVRRISIYIDLFLVIFSILSIPAPDIRFDLRFYLSPTFRKFVESKGYEGIPFDSAKWEEEMQI